MDNTNYGWPTTRCFPRTLNEAFPEDTKNGEWFYPPEQRWQDKMFFTVNVCLWVVLAFYLVRD
jgi:hypothetical protein